VTELVGAPRNRIDGPAKVTGEVRYSADIALEGTMHAVFATSTVAAGRIARIDVAEAEQCAGVVAVFTHDDAAPRSRAGIRLPQCWDEVRVPSGRPHPVRRAARGHGRR
jgi:CO/xanthine dehydrogenase Mo-binding subunit